MDTVASTAQSTLQSHWIECRTDGHSLIYRTVYTPVPLNRVRDRWTQSHLPHSLHSSPPEQSEGPINTVASTAQSSRQSYWTDWRTDGHSRIYRAVYPTVPLKRVKDRWTQSHLPHRLKMTCAPREDSDQPAQLDHILCPLCSHSSPTEQSEGPMDTVASTAQSTLQSHWTEWWTDGHCRIYGAVYTPIPLNRVKDRLTQAHLPRSLPYSPTEKSEIPMDTVASTAQTTKWHVRPRKTRISPRS